MLTPKEYLRLFAAFIDLQLSRTLSEGEKRKLFVAIVMIRS
jgi:hypothetical protein